MRTILKKFCLILTAAICFTACKKDATLTYLDVVDFPQKLTSSITEVVLTPDNNNTSVATFSWPAVTFKVTAPVSYAIQLTTPADTLGSTAWSKAHTITAGDDVLLQSLTGATLNDIALNKLGLPKDTANTVVARVVATLDRKVYSNTVSFKVTPYRVTVLKTLYLPGDYQGWNPGGAPVIREVADKPEMYEGYVYIPDGGSYQFKMTPQPNWEPMAYGDATGTSGDIIEANYAGGNMSVASGGYYYLTANLTTKKWTNTKTTWSILGDASPGGWDTDTQLTYDPAAQVWKVTCNMSAAGSFKFRANNAWVLDFGIDPVTKELKYADNPFLGYTPNLDNLTVPESGNYTITLDLRNAGNYTYILHKN